MRTICSRSPVQCRLSVTQSRSPYWVNEMQLLYYDRSIVAVSQPFQIVDLQTSSQCECLDERRFIVVLICLHRVTLAQRGILENLMPDPFLDMYQNYTDDMAKDPPPASVLNVALLRKRDVGYDYIVTLFFIDALLNPAYLLPPCLRWCLD
ncbi:hypothetical protein CPB85DRAFT_185093 [Mucidula mucida]|nr:hypothetical protein CPB85DRAFT_185093 [Mucidula mucida]